MTLLVLTTMPPKVIEELGTARVNRLADYLAILQNDRGRFFPTYFHKIFDFMPKKVPYYLDGPAVFALARYYQVNPNIDWLIAARAGATWQIEQFRKTLQLTGQVARVDGNGDLRMQQLGVQQRALGKLGKQTCSTP